MEIIGWLTSKQHKKEHNVSVGAKLLIIMAMTQRLQLHSDIQNRILHDRGATSCRVYNVS